MEILVVDDLDANRELLVRMITGFGQTAVAAASGEEAVAIVVTGNVDVVFMDLQMRGIDGFEATRRIRALGHHEVRIYAVTGMTTDTTRRECAEAGMDGFIEKPFSRERIAEILHEEDSRSR